jgi:glycosyltransferase involved in cell wall biosynthesis
VPLVTRFQGTVVYPCLDDPVQFLRKGEEVVALKAHAALTIMTDDGTQGDLAVARLRGRLPSSFRFWRNGLDLDRLRPAGCDERAAARSALNLDAKRTVVLATSRLARWKRVDRAIRAIAAARKAVPELLLLVVGDGEDRQSLERLTDELGLRDWVRFEGAVSHAIMHRYYHACDIFISTNELSNVGNPLLEALACGLPAVTLANGATGSLIRSEENGVLLDESASPECIGEAVACLAADGGRRRRLGEGARATAEREFWTWNERMSAELREVKALAGRRQ